MKIFKKFMATAVALSMAMFTFGAVSTPAHALNGGPNKTLDLPIEKTWNKPANSPVPQTPVTFSVAPVTIPAGAQIGYGGIPLESGVAGAFDTTYTINAPQNNTANLAATTVSAQTTMTPKGSVFTHAGLYRYQVTENTPTFPGLAPTPTTPTKYYVDVFVQNTASGLAVEDVIAFDVTNGTAANLPKADVLAFQNTYTTFELSFTESTQGNGADMTKAFDYTLSLTADNANDVFYVDVTRNGTTTTTTHTGTFNQSISLNNGDTVVVRGLSAGDTYTITESNPATEGYFIQINQTAGGNGQNPAQGVLSVTGKPTANTAYTFINTRTSNVPTAFFTTYGPYVAGVAVLGGLGYAMFRKKKDNE